jgi:hypothetical protein
MEDDHNEQKDLRQLEAFWIGHMADDLDRYSLMFNAFGMMLQTFSGEGISLDNDLSWGIELIVNALWEKVDRELRERLKVVEETDALGISEMLYLVEHIAQQAPYYLRPHSEIEKRLNELEERLEPFLKEPGRMAPIISEIGKFVSQMRDVPLSDKIKAVKYPVVPVYWKKKDEIVESSKWID